MAVKRASARWIQAGVITVGLSAAAAAGQAIAMASPAEAPEPGSASSASDSVSESSDSTTSEASASTTDQSETDVAPDTASTTTAPDPSPDSISTSLGDGPMTTLSAQQNSSRDDEPGEQDEIAQPTLDPAAVQEIVADAKTNADDKDAVDSGPEPETVTRSASVAETVADRGDQGASVPSADAPVAQVAVGGEATTVDDVEPAASSVQTVTSGVHADVTVTVDLPDNPVRAIVAAFLGLFGFNPNSTAPSNPILELAWGLYRRIEIAIAQTLVTVFGVDLTTTTTPTTDTGVDLLGNTRELNVVFIDGPGYVGYVLTDTIRDIGIYETTWYTTVNGVLYPANPPGTAVAKGPSAWDPSAVSAYANVVIVYDFYDNTLYHTSFDDTGAAIQITVASDALNNAYWYRTYRQFVFGHDFEAALDVVGHEYTHAVIDAVVASQNGGVTLGQNGEARALEEAYSDIIGSLIEGKSGPGEWLVGEDAGCDAPSGTTGCAIRNLADPSEFGDPEDYSNYNNAAGEHYNSTIFSFAAFKMITDARTTGISRELWSTVYYRSLYELPAGASFADARGAVLTSAEDLGFTAQELQAIEDAFDAVGIDSSAAALHSTVLV